MAETSEQAELRRHLSDLRHAAHGVGRDIEIKFRDGFETLDAKIAAMPDHAARDVRELMDEIDDDFFRLGRALDAEVSKIPGKISNAGSEIAAAAARVGRATAGAATTVGKATVAGTKNTAARIAGVRRTPMKEWHSPDSAAASSDDDRSG